MKNTGGRERGMEGGRLQREVVYCEAGTKATTYVHSQHEEGGKWRKGREGRDCREESKKMAEAGVT